MEALSDFGLADKQYGMTNFDDTIPFAASARQGKRLRVSRACDRCKKRKIRCTGIQPCNFCARDNESCVYALHNKRGRKPRSSRPAATLQTSIRASHMTATLQQNELLDQQDGDVADNLTSSNALVREPISRASPDAITDIQGHYVGPASGLSFLARVQKRLNFSYHASSSFTFGDAPMADHDPTPSIMISSEESLRLVQRFFDFTVPIDRIVHRPTIDDWLREFQDTMGSMRGVEHACAQRAILWMIFAMAQEHGAPDRSEKPEDRSVRYFLAADYQLSKERGAVSLTSVQARLYQCFWLLSRSRVNHCWGLFGTVARLALALGLHRRQSGRHDSCANCTDQDCRRRTFWSAYCLDTHLSLTLGRPRIFHDEDIDQELPSGSDDLNLSDDARETLRSHGYSKMIAPVAYYRLHRILTGILRDLYSIRPISLEKQRTLAEQYSLMLEQWRDSLPNFLQIDNGETHPLIAIYQRQRDVLHYTYWHAMILTNRPLMLRGFTSNPESGTEVTFEGCGTHVKDGVDRCLKAAMRVANRVCQMFEDGLMFRSFWGTCYYGFAASVVLFVYTIQKAPSLAVEDLHHFETGTRCMGYLATFTKHTPLVARYVLILEELQQEAQRRSDGQSTPSDCSITASYTDATAFEYANSIGVRMPFPATDYEVFGYAPTDPTSWMQFEPLPKELAIDSSLPRFPGPCS